MRISITATFFLLLTFFAGDSLAVQSMRCGNELVVPGDTKLTVLDRCGAPDYQEVISGEESPRVEQWLYHFPGQFPYLLTFRGVTLVDIDVLTKQ